MLWTAAGGTSQAPEEWEVPTHELGSGGSGMQQAAAGVILFHRGPAWKVLTPLKAAAARGDVDASGFCWRTSAWTADLSSHAGPLLATFPSGSGNQERDPVQQIPEKS